MTDLTPSERLMLVWIGDDEYAQYGECYGKTLDELIAKKLVQVHTERELQSGFIAKGDALMYMAVSLTLTGRAARTAIKEQTP